MRTAEIVRDTNETRIRLKLNLDGTGAADIQTGVGFLDHMLTLFARHGDFDLTVRCDGDTEVDGHHSVEDIGISLGRAFTQALGDKRGICRYGQFLLPMDETLVLIAVDLSGRDYLGWTVELPAAKVGFIGLYRDEQTLQPVEYFCKLPQDIAERDVLVLDPMLATGGSAIDAITQIKKHGAKRIKFIGLIAAPEGIEALHKAHPDVDIYLGAKDDHLNENGYIVPGLGDAGDRIYGTK